jgi:hypothetical protein
MDSRERRRLYRDTKRPRCSGMLKLSFPVQCSRFATVERAGRPYCGLHDPVRRGRLDGRPAKRKGKR